MHFSFLYDSKDCLAQKNKYTKTHESQTEDRTVYFQTSRLNQNIKRKFGNLDGTNTWPLKTTRNTLKPRGWLLILFNVGFDP